MGVRAWIWALVAAVAMAVDAAPQAADSVPQATDAAPQVAVPHVGWTDGGEVRADSSNFVTASLLVMSPGDGAIYSSLGHCALRMECPVHDLDLCFSLENDNRTRWIDFVRYFTADLNVAFIPIPTDEFVDLYRKDGRSVTQYVLNLTLREKQELWRALDDDMMAGAHRKFDFLQSNCASQSLLTVEGIMEGEYFDFHGWPSEYRLNNSDMFRYLSQHAPWMKFLGVFLFGSAADEYWDCEMRTGPENIASALHKAEIVNIDSATTRPVIVDKLELVPLERQLTPSRCTPVLVFGSLLAMVLGITLWEWRRGRSRVGKWLDGTLLIVQTVVGCFLVYVSAVSGLFGTHWNWYLVPFNPVPALLWLVCRRRSWYPRVWVVYSVVLVAFLAATPLSSQLDVEHQLLTGVLLMRCIAQRM